MVELESGMLETGTENSPRSDVSDSMVFDEVSRVAAANDSKEQIVKPTQRKPLLQQVISYPTPRIRWTPELHAHFERVVNALGVRSARPRDIVQLMNVQGLTRDKVASHLQKYRRTVLTANGLSSIRDLRDDVHSTKPSNFTRVTAFTPAKSQNHPFHRVREPMPVLHDPDVRRY
ncbi:Myb-like DNA-binding domain [Carpediemonas membranifera]|uniref:Myb-like DNA-binding domain n=1 Tax=Carpediemonas membranifera TaxID=201153 RepID=A0A8J6B757_9EUKA|nr:Myb-like DNA-binding domain [Carpediemonas membranifera]|eukprot:KAG9394499.1 Myb-like DNA-binding domain [Carpediemonas membranifera]